MGPCAVESYDQVSEVAKAVKARESICFAVVHLNRGRHHTISRDLDWKG